MRPGGVEGLQILRQHYQIDECGRDEELPRQLQLVFLREK